MSARLLPEEASPFHETPAQHVFPTFGRPHLFKSWCWCKPELHNAAEYLCGIEQPLWLHKVVH